METTAAPDTASPTRKVSKGTEEEHAPAADVVDGTTSDSTITAAVVPEECPADNTDGGEVPPLAVNSPLQEAAASTATAAVQKERITIDNVPDNCRLYCGNVVAEKVGPEELYPLFQPFGTILEVVVLQEGYGFVQFDDPANCMKAIDAMQGFALHGRKLGMSIRC